MKKFSIWILATALIINTPATALNADNQTAEDGTTNRTYVTTESSV